MNAKAIDTTGDKTQELREKLYLAAKTSKTRRFHALYDKVYRPDFLKNAWSQVKRNKGSAGVDDESIEDILMKGEEEVLLEIQQTLERNEYRPRSVKRVNIPKSDGRTRPLGIPTVRDRIVQASVKALIEPIFEADFLDCSYGFRPNRSAHDAMEDIRKTTNAGYTVVLDADIKGYFDNINHERLEGFVEQRINDRRALKLIRKWLECGVIEADGFHETDKGTPQGGVISPLLANIYLHEFDKFWTEQRLVEGRLVRYADDCAPRSYTRDEGRPLGTGLQEQVPNHPELHWSKARVVSVEGKGMTLIMSDEVQGDEDNEPLKRCRKRKDGVKTGGSRYPRNKPGENLFIVRAAPGIKVA